jgi:DNA sulfur modification protein DndB
MCPLKLIAKMFLFDEDEIPAELRAQRGMNKARIPEIAHYILANPTEYVFSAITASIDGDVEFEGWDGSSQVGKLIVSMTARIIINDGQHRRAGIEEALKHKPELGDETLAVVFFVDEGLKRSQQMFADLNKHAVRPTKSLGILYDLRDPLSQLARKLIADVPHFRGLTETEKTTISNRSIKLFTLSGIHQGTQSLLNKPKRSTINANEEKIAIEFWTEVGNQIPEWQLAQQKKVTAAELRKDYLHAHALALHSLGMAGAALLAAEPKKWRDRLKALRKIDWSRSNAEIWEGRAMVGGRVSKAYNNVLLTTVLLKRALELRLTAEEEKVEKLFNKGK